MEEFLLQNYKRQTHGSVFTTFHVGEYLSRGTVSVY
jgi:hypothetical protein